MSFYIAPTLLLIDETPGGVCLQTFHIIQNEMVNFDFGKCMVGKYIHKFLLTKLL